MASPLNVTKLPAPRVALIDPTTGYISREWYRFFLNLFELTGSGSNPTSLDELQLVPPAVTVDELEIIINNRNNGFTSAPSDSPLLSQIAEIEKKINGLEMQPVVDVAAVYAAIANISAAPVTKNANFTVGAGETWIINNKSGSTCTVTLPTASFYSGRTLTFQNYQAQFLVSASSNVVPLGGGAAGTAILENVVGNWATLVSNGTNWVTMQDAPNNALLIE
jgi:hypothetical protein